MKWICIESEKDLPKRYYEETLFVKLKTGERTTTWYEHKLSKTRWLNTVSEWLDESPQSQNSKGIDLVGQEKDKEGDLGASSNALGNHIGDAVR